MAEYSVRLKRKINLEEAVLPLRAYYASGVAPLSRGHRLELTEEQAEIVRSLPNVVSVEESFEREYILFNYVQDGTYTKILGTWGIPHTAVRPLTATISECQNWALYECTRSPDEDWGTNTGLDPNQPDYDYFTTGESIFHSLGEHVDIVITDSAVPSNSPEFLRDNGTSRFVEYDWHQLTDYVRDELKYPTPSDLLTSEYTYATHESLSTARNVDGEYVSDHGYHVSTTAAGKRNGFAKESNVYSITLPFRGLFIPPSQSTIEFDAVFFYLRAFHHNKPINPVTGRKNPTIVNCSWGLPTSKAPFLSFKDIREVKIDGVTYNESNPFPNGWDRANLYWETGVDIVEYLRYDGTDVGYQEDCKEDGLVIIAAAGNDNKRIAKNNTIAYEDTITDPYNTEYLYRNQWEGAITVGAICTSKNRSRSSFSNFGSGVDVYAPGSNILASVFSIKDLDGIWGSSPDGLGVNITDNRDTNYGMDSDGNLYALDLISGTSMASPQVCGVIACHASSLKKHRYTYDDAMQYLNVTSKKDRLGFEQDYFFHFEEDYGSSVPSGVLNKANLWYDIPYGVSPRNFDGINSEGNGWDFEYPPFAQINDRITVGEEDIYGNRMEDYTQPFYGYESQSFNYLEIGDTKTPSLDSTNPYMYKSSNTTGGADELSGWGYLKGSRSITISIENQYVSTTGIDTFYLQDINDQNIHKEFKILTPPNDVLNYKYNNYSYLADSNNKTLFCQSTRPDSGQITQVEGERTSGCVYPRSSRVYS